MVKFHTNMEIKFVFFIVFLCTFRMTLIDGCSIPCKGASESIANNTSNDTANEPSVAKNDVVSNYHRWKNLYEIAGVLP